MRVRFSRARAPKLANTSATFEHGRWLIQGRLRRNKSAEETGNEPEHQHQEQHINDWPSEEHSKQAPCHPEYAGNDIGCDGCSVTFDALEVLIHDRNGGGYAPPNNAHPRGED